MYKDHRPPPSAASPSSPQSNPTRTNNPRDQPSERTSSFDLLQADRPPGDGPSGQASPPDEREAALTAKDAQKLLQITQHFFTKAALTIASSRVHLPPCYHRESNKVRVNKWFNIILDESDALLQELDPWTSFDLADDRPLPLIIETYLDTTELGRNQTLVIIDSHGRKWDVGDALASPADAHAGSREKSSHVVLERWTISLGDPNSEQHVNLTDSMPNIYKKGVVLFRALYTYLRFGPTYKLVRQLSKPSTPLGSLRPAYRVTRRDGSSASRDTLGIPFYPSAEGTTDSYHFAPLHTPAGPLSIKVSFRLNCNFQAVSSEALMSSQFLGMDDGFFRPSLDDERTETLYHAAGTEVGSLPVQRKVYAEKEDHTMDYGSLSTFHGVGPVTGTSPLSALRAAKLSGPDSPTGSPPREAVVRERPAQGSRASLRSGSDGGLAANPRRPSVSFQPFKAGSLSSSPGNPPPSSPGPTDRRSSISSQLAQARNPSQLTLPQAALRIPPTQAVLPGEPTVSSPASASPKATPNRYSSSFGHRRSRMSSGGSKNDEDAISSGKASVASSSHQQGLDGLGEGGEPRTAGSGTTDDDTISDFIKLLEQKKDLKSFSRSDDASRDASARRTAAALSRYQRMRDSHAAMTDSLSSSVMLHRSSSSSSRQLSSIPNMVAGTSASTSSSPGKPISPHTPHTPAVPSRLSAHSNIDDLDPRDVSDIYGRQHDRRPSSLGTSSDVTTRDRVTTAIDIPTSPGQLPRIRRSSSVAQRQRVMEDEFGMRSASLPLDERPDLSITEMIAEPESSTGRARDPSLLDLSAQRDGRTPSATEDSGVSTSGVVYRPRIGRGSASGSGGRGGSSAEASSSSIGTGSRVSERGGRSAFSSRPGAVEDEEPLLFIMSELGSQSRRSLEDSKAESSPASAVTTTAAAAAALPARTTSLPPAAATPLPAATSAQGSASSATGSSDPASTPSAPPAHSSRRGRGPPWS